MTIDLKWQFQEQTNKEIVREGLALLASCLKKVEGFSLYSKLETELNKVSGLGHKYDFMVYKSLYGSQCWQLTLSTWKGSCREYEYRFDLEAKTIPAIQSAVEKALVSVEQWEENETHGSYYQNRFERVFEEAFQGSGTRAQFEAKAASTVEAARQAIVEFQEEAARMVLGTWA